jgi:hypothetical protein
VRGHFVGGDRPFLAQEIVAATGDLIAPENRKFAELSEIGRVRLPGEMFPA